MRHAYALLFLCACSPQALDVPADPSARYASSAPPVTSGCGTDGTLSFSLTASGLDACNGATARVVVHDYASTAETPVDVATTVAGGGFSVSCASALSLPGGGPAIAAFVDLDGNGRCNDGDLGAELLLFAWRATSNDYTIGDGEGSSWQDVAAIVTGTNTPFCATYFQ